MTQGILVAHSLFRWLVLLAGMLVLVRALSGAFRQRPWNPADRRATSAFTITLDMQLLIGLALYVTSPITTAARLDMATAMHSPGIRYFVVEHPVIMLMAVFFAHAGSVAVRRTTSDRLKFLRAAGFFGASFALLLYGIPWSRLVTA